MNKTVQALLANQLTNEQRNLASLTKALADAQAAAAAAQANYDACVARIADITSANAKL